MVRREGRVGCCRINELYQGLHNIALLGKVMVVFQYSGALAALALPVA